MTRAWTLLAGLSAIAFAAPAAAQSGHGGHAPARPAADPDCAPEHAAMGHCTPNTDSATGVHGEPKTAPADGNSGCTAEHAAMGHCTLDDDTAPAEHGDHMAAPAASDPDCAPEHAAMGHCTPKAAAPAPAARGDHAPAPAAADPDCAPEHAAMGHCTPKAAPPAPGAVGTDLPAGDAPAPAPPTDWYADRIFPKAEMEHARHAMMVESGGLLIGYTSFDLEYQSRKGHDGFSWNGEVWYGGDINRLTIKSEGEGAFGEGLEGTETQLLYSRAIGPYFNAQAGVRQDFGPGADRTYATIGFEGLAPYWFEVEGALFLSDKGDLLGRFEAEYDQRITQKLVLQPAAEVSFALQDVPESGIGAGVSDVALGLRLRYEIVKEFAPYVGVEWSRKLGDTARFARVAGEGAESTSLVVGVKTWF